MRKRLNIAVLFDGAGLARLGLEQAGHICTGYELDPVKHHLGSMVGSGNVKLRDVLTITREEISRYDAVWASPPCQSRSSAGNRDTSKARKNRKHNDLLLEHTFKLCSSAPISWIENVIDPRGDNSWGALYNAAQFLKEPIQTRNRIIGGNHTPPVTYRPYKRYYKEFNICPAITASTWKRYSAIGTFSGSCESWYKRAPSPREAAYHQGFTIPDTLLRSWFHKLDGFTDAQWRRQLYEAIGNGVPVYMARAFGEVYTTAKSAPQQLQLAI